MGFEIDVGVLVTILMPAIAQQAVEIRKEGMTSSRIRQRGSTEEMPGNAHFCIQKAVNHSHSI
jgi:hypothetical protein